MLIGPTRRRQRGLSLVELMVGVTVGLFVVAAAGMLTANQLTGNRQLLLDTQIQQDLRAATDIVTRELRRASYSIGSETWPWGNGPTSTPLSFQEVNLPTAEQIDFNYDRGSGETDASLEYNFGFRWDSTAKVLQTRMSTASWQDLTDRRTLRITAFSVTDVSPPATRMTCPKLCRADGTDSVADPADPGVSLETRCWPTHTMRVYEISIAGEAASDANIKRTLTSRVRMRNDRVNYKYTPDPTRMCPP